MPYVGNPLADAYSARVKQDLTGGSGTSFTLSHAVSSPNDLSIYINHVRQEPTTAYTVNGTALTMTGSVAGTDDFYIIYDELALQSISHPSNQALTATAGTFTSGLVGTTGTFSGALSGTTGTFSGNITGNLVGNVTGNVTGNTSGSSATVTNAAQSAITSVGTLTSLAITGSGGNYVSTIQNSTAGTPYGVHIKEPSGASAGYPLLNVTNNAGSTSFFRVDSSTGHIGIGSSPVAGDTVHIKDTAPSIMLEETSSGGSKRIAMYVSASGTPIISAAQSGGLIDFYCTGVHTARVHSQGVIGQSSSSTCEFPLQSKALGTSNTASHSLYLMHQTNHYDTTSMYIQASFYGSGTNYNRFIVYSNGSVYNTTNTYAQISDERLKSNITDAKSQWDDIKNIKVRNFKKYDTGDLVQLGVVAQELEKVSPSLIEECSPSEADESHNSDFKTEKVKGVKYSILYMKAVKALQEAMERIETLEAKVKALEEA